MSKQSEFFLYLLERYAEHKGIRADKVLAEWNRLGVTDFIYDMYEIYHCERLENAFEDIDKIVENSEWRNGNDFGSTVISVN